MASLTWLQRFNELRRVLVQVVPGLEIKYKTDSVFWRILPRMWSRETTTTMGATIWFPTREYVVQNPRAAFYTLAHEGVHVFSFYAGPVAHVLGYAFPQILIAPLGVAAIVLGASGSLWWILLAVLALTALAPWPAPFRANEEAKAYTMGIAIQYWRGQPKIDRYRRAMAAKLRTWIYWRSVWSKRHSLKLIDSYADRIEGGGIFRVSQAFRLVQSILME